MSESSDNQNLEYSAQSVLNAVHRSDPIVEADMNILTESIEAVENQEIENVRYALESLKSYFEGGKKYNLSKRDAEIFAHYVKDKFSD
jgi:hypothetical protein